MSIAITPPAVNINRLMTISALHFAAKLSGLFKQRLGRVRLASTSHCYPLVTVYSKRLIGLMFAFVGDAAIGMHQDTAMGLTLNKRA